MRRLLLALAILIFAQTSFAQTADVTAWTETIQAQYRISPEIVYGNASNTALKLDIWQNQTTKEPVPTVVYFHSGGWVVNNKIEPTLTFLPYIEMGWNVVNVEYRLANVALAPAAVEDTRCALRWVVRNAGKYNIDTDRIVLSGHSAGGHLALMTGMLPPGTVLDSQCSGNEPLKVAAIINWFGPTDVTDLIQGPHTAPFALSWIGGQPDGIGIARLVSPITYIRKDNPPVITVQGDADPAVPYSQLVLFHQALTHAGVPNELVTVRGGGHSNFTPSQLKNAYNRINAFLKQQRVLP